MLANAVLQCVISHIFRELYVVGQARTQQNHFFYDFVCVCEFFLTLRVVLPLLAQQIYRFYVCQSLKCSVHFPLNVSFVSYCPNKMLII